MQVARELDERVEAFKRDRAAREQKQADKAARRAARVHGNLVSKHVEPAETAGTLTYEN